MAKRKKPPRLMGTAAVEITDDSTVGPSLSIDASVCLGAAIYNIRETVLADAFKRAKGKNPMPLSVMEITLLDHNLSWATPDMSKEKEAKS